MQEPMEDIDSNKEFIDFLKDTEIALIQLVESDFSIALPPDRISLDALNVSFKYNFGWNLDEPVLKDKKLRQLFCFVGTEVHGIFKNDSPQFKQIPEGVAFGGSCKFVVRYLLKHDLKPADAILNKFTEEFALPHAYPYIRGHVDSMFNQMDLPRIIMPLLKKTFEKLDSEDEVKRI